MRIRVLGGGIYGCHLTAALIDDGHDVHLYEKAERLFSGASGACPGRLHIGPHYIRSKRTRDACRSHHPAFMSLYGRLTNSVPINCYAVAQGDSLVDFGTYREVLAQEIEMLTVEQPEELGLRGVEGAILCGERFLISDKAREHFEKLLGGRVRYRSDGSGDAAEYEFSIDCTFGALGSEAVDRYEPCLMVLLEGPTSTAVTIVDGPFASVYPWNPTAGLSSLTSAKFTPFSKTCRTYDEADALLKSQGVKEIEARGERMLSQMAEYWPLVKEQYRIVDYRLAIRAMPKSAADTRLVEVVKEDRTIRVRAGKIDAVIQAERAVKEMIAA